MTNRMTEVQVWQEFRSRVEVRLRQAKLSWYYVDPVFDNCLDPQMSAVVERRVLALLADPLHPRLYGGVEIRAVPLIWSQAEEDYSG